MTRKDADRRPIEALAFDVFGTVVDWRASLLKWFHDFGRERGLAADWAHLVDDWRTAYQPSMEPIRQGLRPFVTLSALHRETLDRLLVDHRLPDIGELDRQRMVRAWHTLDPWPDSVAGLTRLRRQIYHRDVVQRWRGIAGRHGPVRRFALGRHLFRRPVPLL